jgi:tryptophan-rich sensory protein
MPDPSSNPTGLLNRILATAAIWSIVLVASSRIRVPLVEMILLVLGAALTIVIWLDRSSKQQKRR